MISKGSGALYNSYYAIFNCVFYYRFPDWGSDIERRGSGRLYGLYYDLQKAVGILYDLYYCKYDKLDCDNCRSSVSIVIRSY